MQTVSLGQSQQGKAVWRGRGSAGTVLELVWLNQSLPSCLCAWGRLYRILGTSEGCLKIDTEPVKHSVQCQVHAKCSATGGSLPTASPSPAFWVSQVMPSPYPALPLPAAQEIPGTASWLMSLLPPSQTPRHPADLQPPEACSEKQGCGPQRLHLLLRPWPQAAFSSPGLQ